MRKTYWAGLMAGVLLAAVPCLARAQASGSDVQIGPGHASGPLPPLAGMPATAEDPELARRKAEVVAREALIARQKHLQEDAARIAQLVAELKATIAAGDGGPYSKDAVKKMNKVEKLAEDMRKRAASK